MEQRSCLFHEQMSTSTSELLRLAGIASKGFLHSGDFRWFGLTCGFRSSGFAAAFSCHCLVTSIHQGFDLHLILLAGKKFSSSCKGKLFMEALLLRWIEGV